MSSETTAPYDIAGKRVFVAGHAGMVGSAIVRRLAGEECEILTAARDTLDLRRQAETEAWIGEHKPHAVVVAAAKVGGILANDSYPAEFIYDNLMIEANLIQAAWRAGVEKLLFLGTSCVYPKFADQPIVEDALTTGALEPTNQWYAIAKITGIRMCQAYRRQYGCDFISAMPTNLYGENDNFDLETSHVIPALIAKAHIAKRDRAPYLEVWGTGKPRRELMHVEDAADAMVFLLKRYSGDAQINVGIGADITIAELVALLREVVGYDGEIRYRPDKPDGTPAKRLDVSRLHALGWTAKIGLREGLERTYRGHLANSPEAAPAG